MNERKDTKRETDTYKLQHHGKSCIWHQHVRGGGGGRRRGRLKKDHNKEH